MPSTMVAGVDGWRDGWIVARWEATQPTLQLDSRPDFASVLDLTRDCAVVGVDMPLSLPTGRGRSSDADLRHHLGRRSASLFMTPCRQAIACDEYVDANAVSREVTGKGLSKQSWGLATKIREARAALAASAVDLRQRVYEVHPESSFVLLCGHDDLVNKKTARGVGQRLAALESTFGPLAGSLGDAPVGPAIDDALDAIAAAWTARRVAIGDAIWFGSADAMDNNRYDDEGFPLLVPV